METVSNMIAGFLAGLTPSTRAGYRSVVSRWLRWCADNGIDMLRATRTHIEVFAAYDGGMRPAAKNTVYKNLSIICGLYRYLCEEGYIDCDPGEHVRRPKLYGHSDGSYLTREQARLFLAEARGMDARTDALCRLLLLTGARVGEALGLDVEDCHLDDGRPWVRFDRKGDWSQRVAIPSEASEALARLIGGRRRGAVFRGVCGSRPPWASYRPWHCVWACLESRRTRCGGLSARSPVTLACRTGTSWPQAGGTVRRCSTITIWCAVVWTAELAMDCRDS